MSEQPNRICWDGAAMTSERVVEALRSALDNASDETWMPVRWGEYGSLATHLAEALAPLLAEVRAEALREAWLTVHAARFADQEGEQVGPDTFYNGVRHSAALLREQVPGERREGGEDA